MITPANSDTPTLTVGVYVCRTVLGRRRYGRTTREASAAARAVGPTLGRSYRITVLDRSAPESLTSRDEIVARAVCGDSPEYAELLRRGAYASAILRAWGGSL